MNSDLIYSPDLFVRDHKIQVTDLLEDWGLCYHLGFVLKYLAGSDDTDQNFKNLKKAEYYIEREIDIAYQPMYTCPFSVVKEDEIPLAAVVKDWKLSFNHELILYHIKASRIKSIKLLHLDAAMRYIQADIETCEKRGMVGE